MPYLRPEDKLRVNRTEAPESAGELNYALTVILLGYLKRQGESYQTYNDMIGALEGAKLELYRRMVAPYERAKADMNGDVYD